MIESGEAMLGWDHPCNLHKPLVHTATHLPAGATFCNQYAHPKIAQDLQKTNRLSTNDFSTLMITILIIMIMMMTMLVTVIKFMRLTTGGRNCDDAAKTMSLNTLVLHCFALDLLFLLLLKCLVTGRNRNCSLEAHRYFPWFPDAESVIPSNRKATTGAGLPERGIVQTAAIHFRWQGPRCWHGCGVAAEICWSNAVASFTQKAVVISIVWIIGIKVDFILSNAV